MSDGCCSITQFMWEGQLVTAWTCRGDPDERLGRYAEEENEYLREEVFRREMYGDWFPDPNDIDPENVRDDDDDPYPEEYTVYNLGMRVNEVPSRVMRL